MSASSVFSNLGGYADAKRGSPSGDPLNVSGLAVLGGMRLARYM
jgi:hypothetical protein